MGRLSKEKRDLIDDMLRTGYTQKEIAEKVGCSVSSVQRRQKAIQPQAQNGDPYKALQAALVVKVFDLFSIMSVYLEFEHLREDAMNELNAQLIRFLYDIFDLDLELGKAIIDGSEYSTQIIGLIEIDSSSLSLRSTELRKSTIKLLKKKYPEKLASLVK